MAAEGVAGAHRARARLETSGNGGNPRAGGGVESRFFAAGRPPMPKSSAQRTPPRRRKATVAAAPARAAALSRRGAELTLAVPQVVAHRLARLALAGPLPSARDQREFRRMVGEKGVAFQQSWQAMALAAWRAQQTLAGAWLTAWAGAAAGAPPLPALALGVLDRGLAPVHRKAVANAKRLARTRLR